ncbi:hypothetical protein TNCV_3870491 [Trichonephila clavipes]|nr:hypothetical protein TNCV_3870491 [Trichonephila clavipes]
MFHLKEWGRKNCSSNHFVDRLDCGIYYQTNHLGVDHRTSDYPQHTLTLKSIELPPRSVIVRVSVVTSRLPPIFLPIPARETIVLAWLALSALNLSPCLLQPYNLEPPTNLVPVLGDDPLNMHKRVVWVSRNMLSYYQYSPRTLPRSPPPKNTTQG